jgi:hypothetical protein
MIFTPDTTDSWMFLSYQLNLPSPLFFPSLGYFSSLFQKPTSERQEMLGTDKLVLQAQSLFSRQIERSETLRGQKFDE